MQRVVNTCLLALLAIIVGAPRASAATLDVNITFTINNVITVTWGGGYSGTAPVTWAVGTVTLAGTYETLTPTNGTGGSWTNNLRITNTSATNTPVDIDLVLQSGPAAGWTAAGTAAADVFVVKAKANASDAADLLATGSVVTTTAITDFVNNLTGGSTTNEIDLLLQTPTSITTGAGVGQSITLRFTASLEN